MSLGSKANQARDIDYVLPMDRLERLTTLIQGIHLYKESHLVLQFVTCLWNHAWSRLIGGKNHSPLPPS